MWTFLTEGGWIMVPMVLTSVVALTFMVERGWVLRWAKVIPPEIAQAIDQFHSAEDLEALRQICQNHPSPFGRLLQCAMDHLGWPKAENTDALETLARHEVIRLERGLVVLEITVGIAPLMGLVGTILGLIDLFSNLGSAGLTDSGRMAEGIAMALNSTLMGLLIAIPALVAWSYYSKRVETITVEMETLLETFLRHQYRRRKSSQLPDDRSARPGGSRSRSRGYPEPTDAQREE
jgi:biopolymer transport protein ExbB